MRKKSSIIAGLDIGSVNTRIVVAESFGPDSKPRIIGLSNVASTGLRRGAIIDMEETVRNITSCLEVAEQRTDVPIEQAYVSLGDDHICSQTSKGIIIISRADGEVAEDDINRVIDAARAIPLANNREVLKVIPSSFTIDDQIDIKEPLGMSGVRLEVDALVIDGSSPFIKNLFKCLDQTGIKIEELVLSPLAASRAVLNKRQKELGVVLLDIGAGTTGLAVFEEGSLIRLAILPVAAGHITNDLAIGLRTSIEVAEKVKRDYGQALVSEINKKERVDLKKIDSDEEEVVSRQYVAQIIEARLTEIFELVNKELKAIHRQELLPAGAVLVGGGAKLPGIVDLAKNVLGLPVQIGFPKNLEGLADKVSDPIYATAVGLVLWGLDKQKTKSGIPLVFPIANAFGRMKKWFRTFLP